MKKKQKRKNHKVEAQIPFPNMLAMVLVCALVFCLSYVGLCARCNTLGDEIKQLEQQRRTLCLRAVNEQDRWSNMLAPSNLERALKRYHLAMTLPGERQIVRVRRGSVERVLTLAYNNRIRKVNEL